MPNKIIPPLRIYLMQNLKPSLKLFNFLKELFNKRPIIIEKIIGEKGLFSNPNNVIPTKLDKKMANKDVAIQIKMPFKRPIYYLFSIKRLYYIIHNIGYAPLYVLLR